MLRLVIYVSTAFLLLPLLAPLSIAAHNHPARNNKRLFLVPPPPPYVPSLLLTNRYYGHSAYGNGTTPRLFKPNKYLTYCF